MTALRPAPVGASGPIASPPTGADYLDRIRDGRRVYINGERVRDVTAHAAMRNAVRSIARLYDALHDPELRGSLCAPADTGPARLTHRAFRVARSSEDLFAVREAIAAWARLTYGWMGRTPDYKASLTTTFGANAEFYGPFADNARRWYERAQHELPFLGHAVANPPIDRDLRPHEIADIPVRAVRETSEGVVVSGAKVVATGAAMATHCFVGQTPNTASEDPAQAISFITPIDAEGVTLICRASYEQAAARHGSPFDYPLSSRFDENDAIITFDEALIPWENVLIHRDPARIRGFFPGSGFVNGYLFHGCTRFAVKLDFIAGLLDKAIACTGGASHRSRRAMLGEVIAMRHTFWSLSTAMAASPDRWVGDAVLPNKETALAHSVMGPDAYTRLVEIIQKTVGSALIYLPSSAADLDNPEIGPLLERYVRGSGGVGHRERVKIMKLLWDAVGSEFAGRHALYERSYAGGWECTRLMTAGEAARTGRAGDMRRLVDRCLDEYDERGWREPGSGAASVTEAA